MIGPGIVHRLLPWAVTKIIFITGFLTKTVVKHFNGHVLSPKGKAKGVRHSMCHKISKPPIHVASPLGKNGYKMTSKYCI